jgi:hypothetical protein
MPSPFPGMDPFVEKNPIFHEIHTQFLTHAQIQLQPQLRPKYVARLERHLSEGSVWDMPTETISLDGKEPDLTVSASTPFPENGRTVESTAVLMAPTATVTQELDEDELQLRKQRRIVIYVNSKQRKAVASIELLSPSNKAAGTATQRRFLEKRNSARNGGLHWIEIDLLRGGQRPPIPNVLTEQFDYLSYVAQATPTGWTHRAYTWMLREPILTVPIPLLGNDQVLLDVGICFRNAFDATAADDEADYAAAPPPPALRPNEAAWVDQLLRSKGLRS